MACKLNSIYMDGMCKVVGGDDSFIIEAVPFGEVDNCSITRLDKTAKEIVEHIGEHMLVKYDGGANTLFETVINVSIKNDDSPLRGGMLRVSTPVLTLTVFDVIAETPINFTAETWEDYPEYEHCVE